MRVLFICTSPNKTGNTARVLGEIRRSCEAKGADVRWYDTAEMDISGCRGCQRCRGTGVCSIDDDMTIIKDEIMVSDVVVLGSPMYMGAETGQTKCLIDRFNSLFQPDKDGNPGSLVPKGKKAVTIMTCKLKDGDKIYNYENTKFFKVFVNLLGFDMVLSTIVPGTGDPKDIMNNYHAQNAVSDAVTFILP
ncbi:MAG: flavodoxin family protein [Euryarchaeota archaeon]|nr:flavodoxin family protein [Euryarchaeota archaeon]